MIPERRIAERAYYLVRTPTNRRLASAADRALDSLLIQLFGGGKIRMSIESEWTTVEAMEQHAAMAMEGLTQAVGQIDAILAEDHGAALGR